VPKMLIKLMTTTLKSNKIKIDTNALRVYNIGVMHTIIILHRLTVP